MFQLQLRATTLTTPTGSFVRVVDLTDWTQAAVPVRDAWAVLLTATKIASLSTQDADLEPISYEPHAFVSGSNLDGTVDVPLTSDGIYRVRALAVLTVADADALDLAVSNNAYYQLDTAAFVFKASSGTSTVLATWADVLTAAASQSALLDASTDAYARSDYFAQAGLGQLNLKYLEAGNRNRAVLLHEYAQAELLLSGSQRQFEAGYYADAATTLTATERLLGACLPAFYQSLPALSPSY